MKNNKDRARRRLQRRNSSYLKSLRKRATKEELIFKDFLETLGIRFNFQKGFFIPFHRICDFYIKKYHLIVEIDGGYHLNPAEKVKDDCKDREWLSKRNMTTLRITNEQVNDGSFVRIFENFISL